jgi:SAM-dependent methyltransferase
MPGGSSVDDATARALNAINRDFYRERAADFSATREGPWPGWRPLWQELARRGLPQRLRVLDVGCGNGRLGRFLAERAPGLRYTGLDASAELLALAAHTGGLGTDPELVRVDLVEDDLAAALGDRRFDLITCFGVLHHLPGRERRRALLAELLGRLAPGGRLCLTCWRLAQFERARSRILPWETWNASREPRIDAGRLEPGDHLLPWDLGQGHRYVHFAHEGETAELLAELPCRVIESFTADGRSGDANRYFVVAPPIP